MWKIEVKVGPLHRRELSVATKLYEGVISWQITVWKETQGIILVDRNKHVKNIQEQR